MVSRFSNSADLGFVDVPDVEERISKRKAMAPAFVAAMKQMPASERYRFFIKETAARQEVWTLWNNDELSEIKSDAGWVVPVWTHKELVEVCFSSAAWRGMYQQPMPVPIPIDDWIDKFMLKELDLDGLELLVQPLPKTESLHISVDVLLGDWKHEADNFMANNPKYYRD